MDNTFYYYFFLGERYCRERGRQMKHVQTYSIDVLNLKNDFGMSTPPRAKIGINAFTKF